MIERYLGWIEDEIAKQQLGNSPASLYEPIRYIMSLGGKRLRPLFSVLAYTLYKTNPKKIIPLATAVESFHNFTLLHDDIMDNAPLRRGKATVHHKWNVNTAILSGDVMLVKVYGQLLKVEEGLLKEVLTKFNACATEVCEGQQWDMEFESLKEVSEKAYLAMIRQKTAVLLGFSLELGAMLAHASKKDQQTLRNFGIDIGIGFQLKDDWLDVYGDNQKFGKQVGGDILANKKTFLLIRALAQATGRDKKALWKWLSTNDFNKKEKIKAVTSIYNRLDIGKQTLKMAHSYFNSGLSQLNKLGVSDARKIALKNYTLTLIDRNS